MYSCHPASCHRPLDLLSCSADGRFRLAVEKVGFGESWSPPEQTGNAEQTAAAAVVAVTVVAAVGGDWTVIQQYPHFVQPETAVPAAAVDGHQLPVREQGPHLESDWSLRQ